ncbi:hypothetical protein VT84_13625 [Gemmata sp. SH-PL17]|uniref:hypothetical protein n=1 Tax=Gemmata sp. SH-PL17 TaxID=1630693 RepID=UPI00078D013D|nr:hypothetical protein [Gemmata sp. SH-PL17]AMV25436.1 hypothetical protein VT84_13625 [Gemmata sp. SH-PL17]
MATPRSVLSHGLFIPEGGVTDYPAESDVKKGVEYDFGSLVGTYDPLAPSGAAGVDLSNDWRYIDSPATVSYYRFLGDDTYAAPFTVDYVQRAALTRKDVDADPALSEIDGCVYHVWKARLPSPETLTAKILDELVDTDTGDVWTVRSLWRCDNDRNGYQRLRLVVERREYDFRWAVTQKRPSNVQDSAGRPTYATYTTVVIDRPCFLRTVDYAPRTALGRVTAPVRYELTVQGPALDWRAKDVFAVTDPQNNTADYTIASGVPPTKFENKQRITLERIA